MLLETNVFSNALQSVGVNIAALSPHNYLNTTQIKRHILNTFERLSVLFIDCLGRSGLQHSLLLQAKVGYAECEMGARVARR